MGDVLEIDGVSSEKEAFDVGGFWEGECEIELGEDDGNND